jgi:CBS domain containing-hemolysin-like protein
MSASLPPFQETIPGLHIEDPVITTAIIIAAVLVVAFFSSSEASLISYNKVRMRHLAESGNPTARIVEQINAQHSKLFATILLSENSFIIFASSIASAFAVSRWGERGALAATLVMTVLVVIFGEITPKTFATQNADRWALIIARPIYLWLRIISPLVWVFSTITNGLLWLLGQRRGHKKPFITEPELRMLISMSEEEGTLIESEEEMLQNVFKFGDRQARELMTPRPMLDTVPVTATVAEVLQSLAEKGHSRLPVVDGDLDNVVGVAYVKDALRALAPDAGGDPTRLPAALATPITTIMRPAYFTPETKYVRDLLSEMRRHHAQMAILVDEFGGTAGMVTIEDMVEEIVGELQDELDTDLDSVQTLDDKTILVEAHMHINDANDDLGLDLPHGNYETLAGFVLDQLGRVPRVGETLRWNSLRIRVAEMQGPRIKRLELTRS